MRTPHPKTRQVIQYDTEGKQLKAFPSIGEAARSVGVSTVALSVYLSGKRKTPLCAGYVWKYGLADLIGKQEEIPERHFPVDPYSEEYKWESLRQRVERRIKNAQK